MVTDYLPKRTREIYEYYKINGVKPTCEKYQVTRSRVYAAKEMALQVEKYPQKMGELYGLSIGVWNCLNRRGIKTISELAEKYNCDYLFRIRNFGKHAYEEVGEFLREKGVIPEQEEMT